MKKLIFTLCLIFFALVNLVAQNNALKFSFISPQDYVSIPYSSGMNLGSGAFTIEFQIKLQPGAVSAQQTLLSNRSAGSASTGYWISINSNGQIAYTFGSLNILGVGSDLRDNQCHHLAFVRSSTNALNIYLDGAFINGHGSSSSLNNVGNPLLIGRDNFNPDASYFDGLMDELRIWDIARTINDINTYKFSTVLPNSTGLIAYYNFNQGTASGSNTSVTSLINSSSISNPNGQLQNFSLASSNSNWVAGCAGCSAFAGNDTTLCNGNVLLLNPSPSGGTYTDNGVTLTSLTYTATVNSVRTLIYTSPTGCKDTMQIIIRPQPNLGPDRSICLKDSISFPKPNAAYNVVYTSNGVPFNSVFYGGLGQYQIIANASGCKDTVTITVKDTCNLKTCDIFKLDPSDTNCCSAGISRLFAGNSNVTKISYQVTGGVIQGYSASCPGTPSSTSLSGTAMGTVNFNPTCSLQLFNTSLQSTTATGTMTVKYTVKFQNGDSCVYTTEVKGCPRAPLIQCDKVKGEICVCSPGSSSQNFLNLFISNTTIPASSICGIILNYYNSSNVLDNSFFNNGVFTNPQSSMPPLPGPINVAGMLFTAAGSMSPFNLQLFYFSNKVLDGRVEVITIHCNGDTCKTSWQPKKVGLGEVVYVDWKPKYIKSPFSKVNAYSFKIAGPSASKTEPNPYKLKYLTLNIPDSSGGPEIIGLTGAELYSVKGREQMLNIESASHARYTALFKIKSALNMGPADTSGIFQVFFANGIPKNAFFNFYNEEGSMLSSSALALDTSLGVGVAQLGKNGFGSNQMMLFSGYPNPTSDQFNLSISMIEAEEVKLTIMDINGRLIEEKNMGKIKSGLSELNISVAHLSEGTYFIQANTGNYQSSNSIKVVVIK